MESTEIKQLLQKYFNGESSLEEDRTLESYFGGGDVEEYLRHYSEFFGGKSELSKAINDFTSTRSKEEVETSLGIEDEVMNYILENEYADKTKYRQMWKIVTGIAAAVIIVLGGFLFYQEQQKPFEDTYDNPDEAYTVAAQTLQYVGAKYNHGLAELSNFGKIEKASETMKTGIAPVNEFYKGMEELISDQSP